MTDPKARKPIVGRRLRDDSTLKDAVLTGTLASRVKREVAVEKATESVEAEEDHPEERVVVVLGPDGIPQLADAVDAAPETVRIDIDTMPVTKKPSTPPPSSFTKKK
jgi:hypothetical protein